MSGRLRITKKDGELHGLGINNVKRTIENYNAEIKIDYTDKIFLIEILIPNVGQLDTD